MQFLICNAVNILMEELISILLYISVPVVRNSMQKPLIRNCLGKTESCLLISEQMLVKCL